MVRIRPIRISPKLGVLGLLWVLWWSAVPVAGQTIRGRVLEQGSDRPIATAGVTLIDEKGVPVGGAITDSTGNFILHPPRPGKYWARAQRLGYVNTLTPAIDVATDATADIIIRMEIRPTTLDTLQIELMRKGLEIGRSQFTRRCGSTEAICIREARIRASNVTFPNQLFETIPGMAVDYHARGSTVRSLEGWRCFVIFVDHQIRPRSSIDSLVLDDIVGIEVYKSFKEVPREIRESIFAPDIWPVRPMASGGCGIARVWTKAAW